MTGFIGLLDTVRDPPTAYSHTHTSVVDIPLLLGSRTVPGLSYQFLTATAHDN
jgi:hypothetical protein